MFIGKQALAHFASQSRGRQVAYLMLAAFFFLCLATPLNLMHGFLFAEEGTTYFRYARLVQPMQALLAPHQQYFALYPNVLSLLVARVLPLSWAAVASAWLVLCAHLWLIYMTAQCERFYLDEARVLAVVTVLLAPGAAAITVGSTQTQFVFAALCVIVFMSDPGRLRTARTVSVIVGGLNGVVSCMLTPFFLYRAWRTKSYTAWLQAIILCLCCGIQGSVLNYTSAYGRRGSIAHRSLVAYIDALASHMLVLPFLTRFVYHAVSLLWRLPFSTSVVVACAGLAGFAFLIKVIWPAGTLARVLLLIGLFHGACCAMGTDGTYRDFLGAGERYFFVGNTAIALALLLRWQQMKAAPARSQYRGTYVLLTLLLLSGFVDYVRFWKLNQGGAVWTTEVQAWRSDPLHATLTANPNGWNSNRMYVTKEPMRLDLPFYVFDSDTLPTVLARLPKKWFGPDPGGTAHDDDCCSSSP